MGSGRMIGVVAIVGSKDQHCILIIIANWIKKVKNVQKITFVFANGMNAMYAHYQHTVMMGLHVSNVQLEKLHGM